MYELRKVIKTITIMMYMEKFWVRKKVEEASILSLLIAGKLVMSNLISLCFSHE